MGATRTAECQQRGTLKYTLTTSTWMDVYVLQSNCGITYLCDYQVLGYGRIVYWNCSGSYLLFGIRSNCVGVSALGREY